MPAGEAARKEGGRVPTPKTWRWGSSADRWVVHERRGAHVCTTLGKVVVRGELVDGNEGEPLLRPFGQDVNVQRACVVLVKSFAVSSASCFLL
jgi:hypothetical protein